MVATALELTGLSLLAREVYVAQRMEKIERRLPIVRQLQYLFMRKDYRGYWAAWRLDQGRPPEEAQKMLSVLSDADVEQAVRNEWAAFAPEVSQRLEHWESRTTKAAMRLRRGLLVLGAVLLGVAAVLHLFE